MKRVGRNERLRGVPEGQPATEQDGWSRAISAGESD